MNEFKKVYYLGSHTADGFVSHFSKCYNPKDGFKTYILKGGPGTGKSSLMKKAAFTAEDKGLEAVLCLCSSDPTSLDAIIFPEIKTVILDGTAPHVVEPTIPGVCEQIVNLGEAFKANGFEGNENKISELMRLGSECHKAAAGYLSAAGKLLGDERRIAREFVDSEKLIKFANKLAEQIIPLCKNAPLGTTEPRFISAPTVSGCAFYGETLFAEAQNITVIEDRHRAVAPFVLDIVKQRAIENGFDVIALHNPFLPSLPLDHIIIPRLKAAVCTHSNYTDLSPYVSSRMVHSRRFYDMSGLKAARSRLKFDRRAADEMIDSSVLQITKAKEIHDLLERYYISAIDFSVTNSITDRLISRIFG